MRFPGSRSSLYLAFAALCSALFAPAEFARAQTFPGKMVRILSAYPSGISPDFATRVVAEKLSRYWNQQVILEPRPGANGFIAIGALKKAPADGYELLLVGNAHLTINPNLIKNLPYAAESDFVPVSLIYRAPFFLMVAPGGPYKTIPDLIAAAKAAPGTITYSTPYVGSPPHLGGAMFAHLTGTRMLAVHYKEGPPVYTSVANGDIGFTLGTAGSVTGLVKAGKLKMLGIAAPARLASEPDVPMVREAGGPADFEVDSWIGLVAPRGTPTDVVGRIGAAMARALAETDVQERYRTLGVVPTSSTSAEMSALIGRELKRYGDIVRTIGITPE